MNYDLVVIGAGPAGMAAASTAAAQGAEVAVLDAGARAGGQYFRHGADDEAATWAHRRTFNRLRGKLSELTYLPHHRVWTIEPGAGFAVHALAGDRDETPVTIRGTSLVLATGAYDRQLPFPGWDLPGVMTAGGAQALLKSNAVVPGNKITVAGTGPFLLPVAAGLAAAGAAVTGVFEANRPGRDTVALAGDTRRLWEAGGYAASLARHRISYRTGRTVVAAHGRDRLEAVTVAKLDSDWIAIPGSQRDIDCDTLAVGYGFTPQLELADNLGCRLATGADNGPMVAVSATQRTSIPGVYAAGELTGIGGAQLSLVEGRLAGYAATGSRPPGRLLARRAALRRFADRLARAYPVAEGWRSWLGPETTVCRCEEVRLEAIDGALAAGATDDRTVKLLTRAGMGYCQGRICGYAVNCLLGRTGAVMSNRRIAQPIRLGDLAEGHRPSSP